VISVTPVQADSAHEIRQLREQLRESEEIIRALRAGEADALVVNGPDGPKIYTLEGAEHPYRVLIETMNEGAVTLQTSGIILYANARFAEIIGQPLAEIIGQTFMGFVVPTEQQVFAALLASGLTDRSTGALSLQRTAGVAVPVQVSLRALHDAGSAHGCMIVTDMTAAASASAEIRSALAEKELLLREVHHRVKNNLQIMTSLLRLQARSTHEPQISDALLDAQNRLSVMALLHEQLYRTANLATIDLGDYLRTISSTIYRAYVTDTDAVRFACTIKTTVVLDPELAIPLGLIITELLVNSIKHAFPDGRPGLIQLQFTVDTNDLLVIIDDNGVGFEPQAGPSTKLGLDLVTSLARQIKGHVSFEHGAGTTVELRVPLTQFTHG
jgi:PAS domain S-box-containing protein